MQIRSRATRLQQLRGYVILLPPTPLESALDRLLWESEGVFMARGEKLSPPARALGEGMQGEGQGECGRAVLLRAAAEPGAVPSAPVCSV